MKSGDVLIREDGVKFVVLEVAHWSLIQQVGVETTKLRVKWIGGADFVGHAGFSYRLETGEP